MKPEHKIAQHDLRAALLSLPPELRGQAIASALNWSGDDIFEMMCDALTDANFHSEVKALQTAYTETMTFS